MKGFSIITCTYNPDKQLLNRLCTSLSALEKCNYNFEVIIVDNNSQLPIADLPRIHQLKTALSNTRVVNEGKPGLTHARIRGVEEAQYEWIIFFDDDNEPAKDYLVKAEELISNYPTVGCWGPGNIAVEFLGNTSAFASGKKELFQQRTMEDTVIDNVRWGQNAYPYGTGMIVLQTILQEYIKQVRTGNYTMSDRVGKSLISGGDIQILLTGIKMGYYAGSSHLLRLHHLIKSEKTRYKKMLQLVFMLSASAIKTYNQVFPDEPHSVRPVSNRDVLKIAYGQMRMHLFRRPVKELVYETTRRMGELQAHVIASPGNRPPRLLNLYHKMISD